MVGRTLRSLERRTWGLVRSKKSESAWSFMEVRLQLGGTGFLHNFTPQKNAASHKSEQPVWGYLYLVIYGYTEESIRKSNGKGVRISCPLTALF